MATRWPGVVVRCNVGETGDVPRNASATSPDIIVSAKEPFLDPGMVTNPASYTNPYDNSLDIGLPNYLYVRGRNFTDAELTGSWNLFFATPNLLLYPYLWEQNQLATSKGNKNPAFTIKAGDIGASTDCFSWVPPVSAPGYSLIAVANTPGHGNPLAGVNNIGDLATTLANNANIAQRSVNIVRGDQPSLVQQVGYDQGDEPARIDLVVVLKNIPKGSNWAISSGTPLNGRTLSHEDSKTSDLSFLFGWTDLDVPAKWNTMFDLTMKFGSDWSGIPAGQFPSMTIQGLLIMNSSDRLYHLGYDAGIHPTTNVVRVDNFGRPVRAIVVGSITTFFRRD